LQSTCVVCEKDYDTESSTATRRSEKDSAVIETINIYCSFECELIDDEWLKAGNETLRNAQANNPQAFMRTSMTQEQESAMQTFKNLGVRFNSNDKKEEN